MHDYVLFIKPQFVLHRVATAHGIEGDWFELYDECRRDRRPHHERRSSYRGAARNRPRRSQSMSTLTSTITHTDG